MQTDVKKVFYFHADANALGGFVEPFTVIPSQSASGLPSVGGHHSARHGEFEHEVVSCKSSYSFVHGKPHRRNGPWTERVTAVIEGLNILKGLVTAERVVARVLVRRHNDGNESTVSFAGAHFHGLHIDGQKVRFHINESLVPKRHLEGDGDAYIEDAAIEPEVKWSTFWKVAHAQTEALKKIPDVPEWIVERYGWMDSPDGPPKHGYAIPSLVDKLDGVHSGKTYGHIVEIPDKGRLFFGEIMVNPHSSQLSMVRAELGCKVTAQVTAAVGTTNGTTVPPMISGG